MKLWVVQLIQEEPVYASTEDEAIRIAAEEVAWEDNRYGTELYSAREMNLGEMPDSLPWGYDHDHRGDKTCAEIQKLGAGS